MWSVQFFPKQFYCWGSQCCLKCVCLGWDAVSGSLVLCLSCLRSCLPVCQLVLQPGKLCPAPWSCLSLVSGLVSQLVPQSASLFFSLGCCVRLPGVVFLLSSVSSPNLSPSLPACSSAWDAVSGSLVLSLSCLQSCLRSCLPTCLPVCQLVLQPGMLCPVPWSCLCLVSGLVFELDSQSASLFFSLGCCVRLPGLVFVLSPVLSPNLPACSSA